MRPPCGWLVLALLLLVAHPTPGAARQEPARPDLGAGPDGFFWRSPDGRWRIRVGGYLQADQRYYLDDRLDAGVDGFLIRRARPIVEGTVSRYFDFRIMPDFGTGQPTIYEAYVEARLIPAFALRAGKYKPPVGLERLQSATDLRFVERGFPTNIAPNRDVGFQASGELGGGVLAYALGVFNGVVDLGFGDVDASDAKELASRVFITPFGRRGRTAPAELGFGISATLGNERGSAGVPGTSTLRTPGQLTAFRYRSNGTIPGTVVADGRRSRVSPQAYVFSGPVGLLAEYIESRHEVRRDSVAGAFRHHAYQMAFSVFLTGEQASYRSVQPTRPFDPASGGWGALELAARMQGTGVEDGAFPVFADPTTSARRIRAWGVGVNWHFARNIKLMVDYERATFRGGATSGDRPPEHFLATRFQTAF